MPTMIADVAGLTSYRKDPEHPLSKLLEPKLEASVS
jgi:hypothetical protein